MKEVRGKREDRGRKSIDERRKAKKEADEDRACKKRRKR